MRTFPAFNIDPLSPQLTGKGSQTQGFSLGRGYPVV